MATSQQDPVQAYLDSFDPSQLVGGVSQPIGVPIGYAAGSQQVAARYFEGDDWAPAAMTPEDIARLQQTLVAAHLIPNGASYRAGVWDETSRAAYRQVLTHANASGMSPQQSIAQFANSKATVHPDPYLRPDPASVRQTVLRAFSSTLNRDVTDGELPGLVDTYLKLDQQGYQAAVAAQTQAADGATATQAVDPASRFTELLMQKYKPEIDRTRGMVDLTTGRENLMSNLLSMDRAIKG